MPFEAELVFEGLVDRLDPLPYPAEVAVAVGLVLAVRAQQAQSHRLGERRELLAGETFVRQQDLATADQMMIVVQQRREHLAFPDLGVCQAPHDRHAVPGAHQVQLQAPVPSRV
jgi:hypothetical protein